MKNNNKKGFTLAELLIVVAIIGVLVAISIPIFTTQLEKSRRAVDMSNMRNAYAVLSAGINSGEKQFDHTYYYDAASSSIVDNRPAGYGKSSTESSGWWNGVGTALGVPKGKVLELKIDESGNAAFLWGGAYAGLNVTNSTDYSKLTPAQKLEHDKVLLDSIENEIQNMTYGELYNLLFDSNGNLKNSLGGKTFVDGSNQPLVTTYNGRLVITLAESSIINGTVHTEGDYNNTLYVPELFQNVGYNVSGNANENYIVNSVNGVENTNKGKNARLWLSLDLKNINELKNQNNWDKKATNAFTYVKGSGMSTAGIGYSDRSQGH